MKDQDLNKICCGTLLKMIGDENTIYESCGSPRYGKIEVRTYHDRVLLKGGVRWFGGSYYDASLFELFDKNAPKSLELEYAPPMEPVIKSEPKKPVKAKPVRDEWTLDLFGGAA
ncbi:hypothetical protein [Acinetobacter sp. YH12072]|uniref:hypothetical protein n=1 Tax=Acinetobacter sp. YH12072 TaxID=2601068 RepID=UPI0015D2841E|nr:hypothetical protein [Acinetobacter sp. YH12072]